MLSEIYNDDLLKLAGNIPRLERLASPDASVTTHSKLCGSTVTVDLQMAEGRVVAYGQKVKACLLGQSAAAIMGTHIIGCSARELQAVARQMREMLSGDGPPPKGKWCDLALLEPVRDYKARHASTMLVFDAVEQAISKIEQEIGY